MLDCRKTAGDGAANALGRRIRRDEIGMLAFERVELVRLDDVYGRG